MENDYLSTLKYGTMFQTFLNKLAINQGPQM